MKNSILARRYAKALFAVGKEEAVVDAYAKALSELASLYTSTPEVKDALINPMYPIDVRVKVIQDLMKAMGASQVLGNFMTLLVQKKRAAFLPEIAEAFQALVDEENNICRGTVITATELNPALQGKIEAAMIVLTGKKVSLATRVDPALIGGFVAKVGDLVLDGSIKSQLEGLKESIKGSV
ncbi:MAG: F0F1 ATP synthase subunit delta [Deltaproteobacteria bacterium CG_4_10_14_3_um_filter_60_8]|nr:MAG: ATP synthase F1 subunit delta [Desulfobacterales bacterium CG2_30_60_27]PIP42941.1 MAG: F0F1 ATP synthase subunit delta [Deltaproteobacteria bacterium CG23_combo_of_CG06-09_8_20_14_all_60_8]PIY22553.1 MAG: F0F1 ATP synthase subunit delta [Deltaproteobacteria bacterium CG_4_10_14_3_um_filter_60_8]